MKSSLMMLICATLLLSACAPVASYKPYGTGSIFTGEKEIGYKETEIETNKWFVQYVASSSQSEIDMIKFVTKRANEVGQAQCHGAYTKSDPAINSDTVAYVANAAITKKSINMTVTCK